jgi:hypothetical protein
MILKYFFILLFTVFAAQNAFSQCMPGDSISCPDPEENGQICPDTIAPAYQGVDYEQEITFLAPALIDTLGLELDVHHFTLVAIEGLPEGIEWVTNAELDEFYPEIYYCILFSGNTTVDTGNYPVSIVIDIYTLFLGEVIKVAQIKDSTSLAMKLMEDPSFISGNQEQLVSAIWPNPFRDHLTMEVRDVHGKLDVELINILGERVYSASHQLQGANSQVAINPSFLPDGIYFVRLTHGDMRRSYMVSKRD